MDGSAKKTYLDKEKARGNVLVQAYISQESKAVLLAERERSGVKLSRLVQNAIMKQYGPKKPRKTAPKKTRKEPEQDPEWNALPKNELLLVIMGYRSEKLSYADIALELEERHILTRGGMRKWDPRTIQRMVKAAEKG